MNLKKIIYICAIVLCCFSCFRGQAKSISDPLDGNAVNVIESEKSIDIYFRYAVSGEVSDDFILGTNITYQDSFRQGVEKMWTGEYNGKQVIVHAKNVSMDSPEKKIKVLIDNVDSAEDISQTDVVGNRILLYTADGRDGVFYTGNEFIFRGIRKRYSQDEFMYTSGHEFGHILGLPDIYRDPNTDIRKYLDSPMASKKYTHATNADYYMMLKYKTWNVEYGMPFTEYSSDTSIMEYIKKKKVSAM